MRKISLTLIAIFIIVSCYAQAYIDELNGSTLGNSKGITYTTTPNSQGAVFSRYSESSIEYPFSMGLPHQGTIEMLIKVTKGYTYDNFQLKDNQESAFIFNTGASDVWYYGAMWLVVDNNGGVSLTTALTATPTSHSLSASNTSFRFNEWHVVSFSYGDQGQYLNVDGKLVASNSSYQEELQACGNKGNIRDIPTIGEIRSAFWENNQYDQGFEGVVDRLRISSNQQDWALASNIQNSISDQSKSIDKNTFTDIKQVDSLNKNTEEHITDKDIFTKTFSAEFNSKGVGYTIFIWLVPSNSVVKYLNNYAGLVSFNPEIAQRIIKISPEEISSINTTAIVQSVQSGDLYLSDSYLSGLSFDQIPELDSIIQPLKDKDKFVIAAEKDRVIKEILKVREKYIKADSKYFNTKFELQGKCYFDKNNYDLNSQTINVHLSIDYNSKYYSDRSISSLYVTTLNIVLSLNDAQELFRDSDNFFCPVKLIVNIGNETKKLDGEIDLIVNNCIVLQEPIFEYTNSKGNKFKFRSIGLVGQLFPPELYTRLWNKNTATGYSPWGGHRLINGEKINDQLNYSKVNNKLTSIDNIIQPNAITETAQLKVRLFFKDYNNIKNDVYEIKDFDTKRIYDYCYDSESFNRMVIEGNGQNITVIVSTDGQNKPDEYIHLKNENIEIKDKKIYTYKDFNIMNGNITIKQGETILFKGKIISHGCM